MRKRSIWVVAGLLVLLSPGPQTLRAVGQLGPTLHPALPSTLRELWLVPSDGDLTQRSRAALEPLVGGLTKYRDGDYGAALTLFSSSSLTSTPLSEYASYYKGLTQLRLARAAEARAAFDALEDRRPQGYLAVAAALGEAEAAEALGDYRAAINIYSDLADSKSTLSEDVLSRLGRAALAAGDKRKAADAFRRVYYEFALTDAAIAAASQLEGLQAELGDRDWKKELGRALMLFGARRYAEIRPSFVSLQRHVSGDDREVVDLRIAECDFYLKRYQATLDGTRPYLDGASRRAEARFFYLSALRELGRRDEYIAQTRSLIDDFPDSSWSEEALNNLATYYIVNNEDAAAADAFGELIEKFPSGPRAERAAWKYGWWKYKTGRFAETIRIFEDAATQFRRSDYRPSYLYWAARAHGRLGHGDQADSRMRLVHTDYGNSYYGRLAHVQLSQRAEAMLSDVAMHAAQPVSPSVSAIPTERLIRTLLAVGFYDDALNELRFAQRAWGASPALDATIAWAYHRKGELRRAITLMRRAYPQHLTASHELPTEILKVIFPLTYWDQIRKHATARGLDPYVVAALIAQESTFDPQARSVANAWGLMQILPSTGRRLAQSLGIKRFSTQMLTHPETNIRLGTLHFSRLVQQFGGTYYALASYNAGENRVVRWKAERPGLDQDEFIDDIPFPETQNYVKRILGTAEDYRTLYGSRQARPIPNGAGTSSTSKPTTATAPKKPAKKPVATKKPAPSKSRPAKKPAGGN